MGEWAVLRFGGKRGAIPAVVDAWGTLRNVSEGWSKVDKTAAGFICVWGAKVIRSIC